MKKLLVVATLSIAVAAVIKRVTGESRKHVKHTIIINGRAFDDIAKGY